MALLRFDPGLDAFSSLLSLQDELERLIRNPASGTTISGSGAYPPVNIFDADQCATLMAETPGLDLAKLNVSGKGRTLSISGERHFEPNGQGGYHRRELGEGRFSRSFQLPEDYDVSRAEARYEAGLLIIRVPRAEQAKARQITVQSS